jgi:predicted membrane chloride channel (bestrophin family)
LLIFFFIGEVVLLNQQHPLLRFFFMKLFLWRKLELILANKLVSTIFSLLIGALCDKVVDITAIIEQPFGLEPLKLSLDLFSHVISLNLMKPLNGTYPQQHPAFCTSWVKPSG